MPTSKDRALKRAGLRALGQRVATLRRAKGWNRTTLARKAGVTVATVRGCEDGTKVTQPEKLQQLVDALGVPLRKLEVDEADPRVKHWTEEDYEIGNWYHHAPRQVKHRIWALQESTGTARALLDPQFAELLEGWMTLTQEQKSFVLRTFDFIRRNPDVDGGKRGGTDETDAARDPKARGPQR